MAEQQVVPYFESADRFLGFAGVLRLMQFDQEENFLIELQDFVTNVVTNGEMILKRLKIRLC